MAKGWCVWITGLPGSGKSTIARILLKMLQERGIKAQIVSSDALRKLATPKPKYTEEERDIVYGALVYAAKVLTENGVNVIIDATGNKRKYREMARREIEKFMEAYLKCPLETCIERELSRKETHYAPRGIYMKALTGESKTVPGLGAPYEEPKSPEVIINTEEKPPEESAGEILKLILSKFEKM
ncbi:MAG: adenylyl-sulfate kinase [archaeon GB-1867-005]|nr:adenylyl-sulfate kinase [Candidatus Culexmicrobium cathedralense]